MLVTYNKIQVTIVTVTISECTMNKISEAVILRAVTDLCQQRNSAALNVTFQC